MCPFHAGYDSFVSTTRSWWYQQALARPWFIYLMCGLVAAFVIPWWMSYADSLDRPDGARVETVRVLAIDEPDKRSKTITVAPDGVEQQLAYDGDLAVGDRIEVWDAPAPGQEWHTDHEKALWQGLVLTGVLWGFAGFAAYGVHRRRPSRRVREAVAEERL